MNDEIKEILDKVKEISKYGADGKQHTRFFNQFEAKSLLDHITNLQQDNEKIGKLWREEEAHCILLKQENEILHKNNQDMQEEMARVWEENEELKKKLDRRYYKNEYERIKEENERLKEQNNDLRKIYRNTYNKLFENGNDELARYFQAQIDDCPTFYIEPIIDFHKEWKDYKSRCEKASENLQYGINTYHNGGSRTALFECICDSKNILQKGSDSQ